MQFFSNYFRTLFYSEFINCYGATLFSSCFFPRFFLFPLLSLDIYKAFCSRHFTHFFTSLTVPSASNISFSDKYFYTLMHSIEIWVSNSSMSFYQQFPHFLQQNYSLFSNVVCICSFHLSNPREIVPRLSDKLCKS